MLPDEITNSTVEEVEYETYGTRTYRFDINNGRIIGWTDGLQAFAIACHKILGTQRYAHIIYSGEYGFDLAQYVGKDFDYIQTALPRELSEALGVDDRFQGIEDFIITKTGLDSCKISFKILSTEGTVPMEIEV